MQYHLNSGVGTFLAYEYQEQLRKYRKPPIGFYLHRLTVEDLLREIREQPQTLLNLTFMGVPVNITNADVPYLRNHFSQIEIL